MKRLPKTGDRYISRRIDMEYKITNVLPDGRYEMLTTKPGYSRYKEGERDTINIEWIDEDELQPNFIDYAKAILHSSPLKGRL